MLEFLAWALEELRLGINLVSYKSPLDFIPKFGSSFGEGIGTNLPQFTDYQAVFDKFGFGDRVSAMILSQIYPIENYLTPEGKPHVIYRRGRNSGKTTKRYLSRRRLEKALGIAPTEDSLGDMTSKKIVGGSDLCRIALWQWIFTRLEVKRCRPKTKIGQYLGQVTDREKATGKHIRIVRMRIAAQSVRLLFKELMIAEARLDQL